MKDILRSILAFLLAIVVAYLITTTIIIFGHEIIPVPEGMNTNDFESIKSNFHLFKTKHFIFPLLAHAVGTFISAFIVSHFAVNHKFKYAVGIGFFFTLASLILTIRIGHFNWIGLLEIGHYIPVSILAYKIWERTLKSRGENKTLDANSNG